MPISKEAIKLIADFSIVIVIFVIDIVIDHNPFVVERGFFPNDESLMHPLKPETIDWKILLILTAIMPAVVIAMVEFLVAFNDKNKSKVQLTQRISIPLYAYQILKSLYLHWLVLVVTFFMTDVLKFRIGRLRPHFLTVCQLDMEKLNDTTAFINDSSLCRGAKSAISIARQSFPSGHSSMSMSAVTSLIIFAHCKLWKKRPGLRLPVEAVSLGLLAVVVYVASSRLIDYWHHPLDICAGVAIGFIVTIVLYYSQSNCLDAFESARD